MLRFRTLAMAGIVSVIPFVVACELAASDSDNGSEGEGEGPDRFGVPDGEICTRYCARVFECRDNPEDSGFETEADCVVGCGEIRAETAQTTRAGCADNHTTMYACATLSCEDNLAIDLPDQPDPPSCPTAVDAYLETCVL